MNKIKKIIISVGVIAIILIGVGITLTYFRSNFISSKKIATDIFRATYTSTLEQPSTWVPGSSTTGNFKVKNESNMSVAVRAKIEEHWYDASSNEIPNQINSQDVAIKTIGTGWGLYNGYYYYYKTLDNKDEETNNFIPTIEFANLFEGNTCTSNGDGTKTCAYGAPYSTGRYSLVVTFEVIQADAYESEWAVNVEDNNVNYEDATITFNAGDGSVNTASKFVTFNKETGNYTVGDLPTAVKEGYTFVGWFTQSTGGEKIKSNSTIDSNTTLYARWFEPANTNIKMAYIYDETTTGNTAPNNYICVSGNESTCEIATCIMDEMTCPAGTIVDYKVDGSTTVRFHVLQDKGSTVVMQSQENTIKNVAWHAGTSSNASGPDTILPQLITATQGWSNVNNQTYTTGSTVFYNNAYIKCSAYNTCNETGYVMTKTNVKARMISLQEATASNIGHCTINLNTCAKFMHNFLYQSTSYGGTDADNGQYNGEYNYCYLTMSALAETGVWSVCGNGSTNYDDVRFTFAGARTVVEIDK